MRLLRGPVHRQHHGLGHRGHGAFDGRRVRLGSSIFKASVPVAEIVSAEALTATSGRPFRSREYIKLVAATGVSRVPCRNAETLVQLIEYYRPGGG